jgi:hypothetical protein
MAATPEQLAESRKKAVLSPDIGKHGKWKSTIAKEERQKIFDEIVSQEFEKLIADARAEYKLDRFMGKVPDEVNVNAEVRSTLTAEVLAIAEEELKKRKLNDE